MEIRNIGYFYILSPPFSEVKAKRKNERKKVGQFYFN